MQRIVDPRLRVGIIDITAAILVVIAMLLPARSSKVESAYAQIRGLKVTEYQANLADLEGRLAANPKDQITAEELARQLEDIGQHDQALRVAGAAKQQGGPAVWRALRAISYAHAERFELEAAHETARQAMAACDHAGSECDPQEQIRLQLYLEELEPGVRAVREGIDPFKQPERFRNRIYELHPTSRSAHRPKP